MNLTDILTEILLSEKIVKVPESEIEKAKELYSTLKKNQSKLATTLTSNYKKASKGKKDYFTVTSLDGDQVNVTVRLYYSENDDFVALAGGDSIYINVAKLKNVRDFVEVMEHELVHIMDPKLRKNMVYSKLAADGRIIDIENPGSDFSDEKFLTKYYKDVTEFDSFSTQLVRRIRENLSQTGEYKKVLRDNLIRLFNDLKTKEYDTLVKDKTYTKRYQVGDEVWDTIRLLSNIESWDGNSKDWEGKITEDFWIVYGILSAWKTAPTVYKRFLKRLGTEL